MKEYIEEQMTKMQKSKVADAQEIREVLTSILRRDMKEDSVVGINDDGEPCHIEKEVATKDVMKAAELLAKLDGMFEQKQQTSTDVKVIIDV